MAVSIYTKSESGDHYLDVWDNYNKDKIKKYLMENIEMFQPLAEYMISVSGADIGCETELTELMKEIHKLSWNC